MNDQKDNTNKSVNSYGQGIKTNDKTLSYKPVYEFASKKTEKLVTALYMITDCMDSDDALKSKLRALGVELLSDIYRLSILSPIEKDTSIASILVRIGEIISFIEISHTIGFVSEMNANILKKEFTFLISELNSYQSKNQTTSFGEVTFENQKRSSFILREDMFAIEKEIPKISQTLYSQISSIKDTQGHIKNDQNKMSFTNNFIASPLVGSRLQRHSGETNSIAKDDRSLKILGLIKDKKDVAYGISIKDISIAFPDYSEKTIQRDLNFLVAKGQIKKSGEKRWSRYSYLG
jgi:hypothetical protein